MISAAAHNIVLLMRSLFKMGTPRGLQQFKTDLKGVVSSFSLAWLTTARRWKLHLSFLDIPTAPSASLDNQMSLVLVA